MTSKSPINASETFAKIGFDVAAQLEGQQEARLADLRSGAAWDQFCDALRGMGRDMLASEFAEDDLERADGYRYMLGLIVLRLNRLLYHCGPENPAFNRAMDDILKFGLDNPDGVNSKSAEIRDDLTYRIFGKAGGERYVEFVQSGERGTLSNHYLEAFEIAADGSFEIVLSANRQPGNWLPMAPGARSLMVRQIQYDWDSEGYTELYIEGPQKGEPYDCLRIPDPATVGAELRALAVSLPSEFAFWQEYTRAFRREGDNVIPVDQPLAMSGHSTVRAAPKGFFSLEKDQAMLIEIDDPGGLFWSVAIGDTWFRTFDPSHRHTSLNGFQARRDEDGKYRFLVAHEDPGIANWLDTCGHRRGNFILRYVRTDQRPAAKITVASPETLLASLPASTACMSPEEREQVIARRARAYSRRYAEPTTSRWSRFA